MEKPTQTIFLFQQQLTLKDPNLPKEIKPSFQSALKKDKKKSVSEWQDLV